LLLWVGKEIALLQAEASACVLGLANVLFVRWLFIFPFFLLQNYHCRFLGLLVTARVYAERTAGICESKAGKLEPASPAGRSV